MESQPNLAIGTKVKVVHVRCGSFETLVQFGCLHAALNKIVLSSQIHLGMADHATTHINDTLKREA